MLSGITWLGHASVLMEANGVSIITDPYQLQAGHPVDIILITHSHYDHLSPEDIKKVRDDKTTILAPADCAEQLGPNAMVIKAGDRVDCGKGVVVEAYPAYNTDKEFHTKNKGWLGYVVDFDGRRVYIAGDTDRIAEMKNIACDVAFLPAGGTYTMTAEAAAKAVKDIGPAVAIPIHWGTIVGSRADAEKFVKLVGEQARLMEPQNSF
jgi:L-ascorbate metabolism protein UlaG (beta-lactamase superfamily)